VHRCAPGGTTTAAPRRVALLLLHHRHGVLANEALQAGDGGLVRADLRTGGVRAVHRGGTGLHQLPVAGLHAFARRRGVLQLALESGGVGTAGGHAHAHLQRRTLQRIDAVGVVVVVVGFVVVGAVRMVGVGRMVGSVVGWAAGRSAGACVAHTSTDATNATNAGGTGTGTGTGTGASGRGGGQLGTKQCHFVVQVHAFTTVLGAFQLRETTPTTCKQKAAA